MKIDLSRFKDTFFQEAAEHVNNMEASLLGLGDAPADPEILNSIFRGAHSIKGGSGTFGFDDVMRFTHRLEELLDRMREGKCEATPARIHLLLRACDMLRTLLAAAESGSIAPPEAATLLEDLAVAQRQGEFVAEAPVHMRSWDPKIKFGGRTAYSIRFIPSPDIFREGMDPLLVLRELDALGTVEEVTADLSTLPALSEMQPENCYLSWTIRLTSEKEREEIEDVFAFVENGTQITIESKPPVGAIASESAPVPREGTGSRGQAPRPRGRDSASIRVDTAKVDQLINLVGELVIAQSMTLEIVSRFTPDRIAELQAALHEVSRNTRELQERVMAVRMMPVGTIFSRLPRIVHDIATAEGKNIRVEVAGEDTELDKSVLEGMTDPLTHLVRNAADHGMGTPEERRGAGKPENGTIHLRARHEGGNVVIEVSDDGNGLNTDRIRQKAIERGLLTEEEVLTKQQIQAFIFHAGFSTRDTASEVSGRGVGMDVVKKNVEALGGIVTLKSAEGQGTTVGIKLPLTLAILDGQLVRVGGQRYVLPLVSIIESIRPAREHVRAVAGEGEVVMVRQKPLPLLRLHQLFDVPTHLKNHDTQGLELQEMINAVTTHKTSFFREGHHFDYLRDLLLIPAQKAAVQGRRAPIRIWSAGCSSGEEPYSIAITVVSTLERINTWDVKILGSDIDTDVVEKARTAIYPRESVADLTPDQLRQNFRSGQGKSADLVQVKPHIRNLVKFGRVNLMDEPWPFRGKFDAIFCRNVMIYFERDVQKYVLEKFAQFMKPGGLFFAGHSENLFWLGDSFRPIGRTVYQVGGARGNI